MSPKEKPAPSRPPHTERRLAALLHADAYGYSRLINEDESGTLRVLTPALALLRELVQQYGGSSVGSRGDSLLAEFPSVVAAVQCAIEMQHALQAKTTDLPENNRIAFRIGISLGEIVIDGDQPHGDGINIAVRIEGLAEPGEICLSEIAYQQVKNKLSLQYDDLGPQQLKNIPEPVRVYRIILNEAAWAIVEAAQQHRRQLQQVRTPRRSRLVLVSVFVSVVLVTGIITVRYLSFPVPSPQSLASTQSPIPNPQPLPLPDKPSIVVLPFTNMSGDPSQDYFSDGITEVLTGDLSKISSLFVIARNSAFTYKGKAVKVQDVGREMGVRYVLEGSVRRGDNQVRITAPLIDATQGQHLWGERYDRPLQEIFAVQDEIRQQIVFALKVKLTPEEQARLQCAPTNNLEAYEYYLRGWQLFFRMTKETNAQARQMFEKALELDPQYGGAYGGLGVTYWIEWLSQWNTDPQNLVRAEEMLQQAIALDESLSRAHAGLGFLKMFQKQYAQATAEIERALALDPNSVNGYRILAYVLMVVGRTEESVEAAKKAVQLDPRQVQPLKALGEAYWHSGRYEEAIPLLKQVLTYTPSDWLVYWGLAVSYSELGREEEARAAGAEMLRLVPHFSIEKWKPMAPYKDPAVTERIAAAARKAGLK